MTLAQQKQRRIFADCGVAFNGTASVTGANIANFLFEIFFDALQGQNLKVLDHDETMIADFFGCNDHTFWIEKFF